ncbi:hypothetical protein lerEdw1_006791 [Lerista edwardsae]|nr:hypothetical protein lerEdw1_006791 [Lerista edwardsae]
MEAQAPDWLRSQTTLSHLGWIDTHKSQSALGIEKRAGAKRRVVVRLAGLVANKETWRKRVLWSADFKLLQRVLPQSKETLLQSYNKRLKDDIKSIMDNFTEIIKTAKVRAGESLMKLVSDLKQFLILNDFPSVNEGINQRNQQLRGLQEECDKKLITLRDEISVDLYELEEEYYSSSYSLCDANSLPLCEAYWRQDPAAPSPEGLCSMPLAALMTEQSIPAPPSHPHVNGHGAGPTEHA